MAQFVYKSKKLLLALSDDLSIDTTIGGGKAVTDFDRFAEPIAGDSPCGLDCEYDNDFLALSQAVAGKPEQQFGDTVIPAVDPDWRQVDTMARTLLERTRDLRIVCWLALANTHLHGISAFAGGLKLMVSLCEAYWDEVHPRIEVDGDTDPYLRINAISAFTGGSEFSGEDQLLQALRGSVLTTAPVSLTYRDLELSFGKAPDATYSAAQLESILADAAAAGNTNLSLVQDAWQSYQALRKLVDERVNTGDAPDMERLGAVLKPVAQGIERMNSASSAEGVDATPDDGSEEAATPGASRGGISGQVSSREDARRALERVCEYLERHEPSNPASLFARRAQRMLSMNFLDIMRELSPDSMHQLETLTGTKSEQE
ncbi:MAG: type VI secretion system protein TssA [Casimicrobium sp.]|jgi:type VI secretion system protein ImpA